MNNKGLDKIKNKIEKLLKLEKGAKEIGSLEEAANAAAKAQTLMVKYNIEASQIDIDKKENTMNHEIIVLSDEHKWTKIDGFWMFKMYKSLSQYNFCEIILSDRDTYYRNKNDILTKKKLHRLYLLGEPINIEMVKFMAGQLIERLKMMQKVSYALYGGPEKRNAFKRGYFIGAVEGINMKLAEMQEANQIQYTGLTGLIKMTGLAIQDKKKELFGNNLTQVRRKQVSSQHGRAKGQHDGSNMSIRKGIKTNTNSNKYLT